MRVIKFRAWYFKEKRMIDWREMKDETETIDIYLEKRCSDISEPMQFTGLTDKNGKEIFEGDIVEKSGKYLIQWRDKEARFHVHRLEDFQGFEWYKVLTVELGTCEIIGNIHENPELLNRKEKP